MASFNKCIILADKPLWFSAFFTSKQQTLKHPVINLGNRGISSLFPGIYHLAFQKLKNTCSLLTWYMC